MSRLFFALLVLAAGLGAYFLLNRSSDDAPEEAVSESAESEEETESQGGGPDLSRESALSLARLAEATFDGRELRLPRVNRETDAYTEHFATYKSGDLDISGVFLLPKSGPPAGGYPVAVLNHGHIDTSVYTNGRGLRREQDYLARQGFAVFHPDYRNHAQSSKTDDGALEERIGYVTDVVNAVYALRASDLPLNKERVYLLGHSMGGGIIETIMVARPGLVRAYALYAPVSMDYRDSYERWISRRPEAVAEIRESYGAPDENPEFWDSIAPRTYADRITEPVKIYHGTNDADVPIEWSRETERVLREAGKDVELIVYPGEGHEFGPRWNDFMASVAEFFRSH